MRKLCLPIILLLTAPADAAEKLSGQAIITALNDVSLYGVQNGAPIEQIFQKSGTTFYLVNGASSIGQWEVRGEQYCSVWPPNPTWSCFDVFEDFATITFVGQNQQTYVMQKKP